MTDVIEVQRQTAEWDAVNWFEIPTPDLDRAVGFYEMLPGQKMRAAVERLKASGLGALVLSKLEVPGGFGWIACVRDTEGDPVALHEH